MIELIEMTAYFFNWLKETVRYKIGKTLSSLEDAKSHV